LKEKILFEREEPRENNKKYKNKNPKIPPKKQKIPLKKNQKNKRPHWKSGRKILV
jgi:hypothetical protein